MKNQVNKKVSKLLIALLSVIVMCVSCFLLTACNEECAHANMSASEDTATCVSGGIVVHTCADCGYSYSENTQAKDHTYSTGHVVAATCTAGGYTVATCTECGETTMSDFTEKLDHAYGDPVVVKATCTTPGTSTIKCNICGDESVDILPVEDHKYTNPVETAPTCTTDGFITTTCVCGATKVEASDKKATGHSFTNNVEFEQAATCTTDGYAIIRCDNCDVTKQVNTDKATGHSFATIKNVAATCEAGGYVVEECAACDAQKITETTAIGHDYANGTTTVVKAADCTNYGIEVKTCANCASTTTITTAPNGHAYGEAVKVNATCAHAAYEYSVCSDCGHELKVGGEETGVACQYDWANAVATKAPTCREYGYGTAVCTVCGGTYEGKLEMVDHKYVAAAEAVAATCTEQGYTTYSCEYCNDTYLGDATAKLGHKWTVTVNVNATCTTDGYTATACERCDAEKRDSRVITTTALGYHTMLVEAGGTQLTVYYDETTGRIWEKDTNADVATCNLFANYDEINYAFYCTACDADDMAMVTTLSNDSVTKDDEYIPVKVELAHGMVEQTAHTFVDPSTTLSIAATCDLGGSSVKLCTVCAANDAFRGYTMDGLKEAELVAADLLAGTQVVSYAEVTALDATGHIIPGECTVAGLTELSNGSTVPKYNDCDADACIADAAHRYGCSTCGKLIADGDFVQFDSKLTVFVDAYKTAYDTEELPLDGSLVEVKTGMAANFKTTKLGHTNVVDDWVANDAIVYNWVIATAIDSDNMATVMTSSEVLCNVVKPYIANQCERCAYVSEYKEIENVPHVAYTLNNTATTLAEAFSFDKTYYAYTDGFCGLSTTETEIFVYDYLVGAGEYACTGFNCTACAATVAATAHIGDVENSLIGCFQDQHCFICNTLMVETQHTQPTYTCYDNGAVGDGKFSCADCGAKVLGDLTPHASFEKEGAIVYVAATCYGTGSVELTCDCGTKLKAGSKVDVAALTAADKNNVFANTDAALATDGVLVAGNFTEAMELHTIAAELKVDATCTDAGKYYYNCAVEGCPYYNAGADKTLAGQPAKFAAGFTTSNITLVGDKYAADPVIKALGHDAVKAKYVAATCSTDGYNTLKCNRCGMEDLASTASTTKLIGTMATDAMALFTPALIANAEGYYTYTHDQLVIAATGHEVVLEYHPTRFDCQLGKAVTTLKLVHTGSTELCDCKIDVMAAFEADEDEVLPVLYYKNVPTFLNKYLAEIDYKNASTLVATVQTKLDDGYTFVAQPHNYTTFKMADGEGNKFAAPANCADYGDAYWKCATCSAETFRENSLSMKDYLDPSKNVDYSNLTPAQKEVVHAGTELACGEHCDDANCVYADSKEADCATAAYVVKYGSTTETLVVYHNAADDNAKVQKVSDGYAMSATKANAVWTALGDLTGKVVKANGVEVADATALAAIVFNGSNTIEIVVEVAP